jgi:hypothetical protein
LHKLDEGVADCRERFGSVYIVVGDGGLLGNKGWYGVSWLHKLRKRSILNFHALDYNRCQLNYFIPLTAPSCCFKIKNNIKDTSPINIDVVIFSWWDRRRRGTTLVTAVTSFGPPTLLSATGFAVAAGAAKHF